jgi:hypothetical protein
MGNFSSEDALCMWWCVWSWPSWAYKQEKTNNSQLQLPNVNIHIHIKNETSEFIIVADQRHLNTKNMKKVLKYTWEEEFWW